MENYRSIANQSYDTIPKEMGLQLVSSPRTRELRFVKVAGLRLMYDSYALQGDEIPALHGFDFVDVGRRKDLVDILKREIGKEGLPKEIRIIRPNYERDAFGVFIKK